MFSNHRQPIATLIKEPLGREMNSEYYAHTLEKKPPSECQPLEEHLKNVAELARRFADVFGAGDLAYLAGLWHDLGKCAYLC